MIGNTNYHLELKRKSRNIFLLQNYISEGEDIPKSLPQDELEKYIEHLNKVDFVQHLKLPTQEILMFYRYKEIV